MDIKKCKTCNRELPETSEYFCKQKSAKNGLMNLCKECRVKINKKYKDENKEKLKEKRKIKQNHAKLLKVKIKKTTEEFKAEIFNLVGDEYQVLGEYINATTKIGMLHKKCLNKYEVTPRNFSMGNRCPFCCTSPHKVGIGNCMWDTNPELAKLLLNPEDGYKYTQYSHERLNWKCHECDQIIKNKQICKINVDGLSCPRCGDGISYPNRLMFSILNNLHIDFKPEKSFEWCQFIYNGKNHHGKYDFYFIHNNQEYIIEMDGGFHFNDNLMNGQTKEESIEIDLEKERLAKEHNILPIRIDSQESELEYIKTEILKSDLKNIFDLSVIDWQECERQSLTSLKLQACELWEKHHSTKIISEIMKKSRNAIINWLKLCAKSGLCDYKPVSNRAVICIDTNEYFNLVAEAGKKYNLDTSSIVKCCRGKAKSVGKLHWKYSN